MPDKAGRFSDQEKRFNDAFSRTKDREYARWFAGYKSPASVTEALQNPAMQADIRRREMDRLTHDTLPLAIDTLHAAMSETGVPWGQKIKAADTTLKYAMAPRDGSERKDIASMSADELQMAIDIASRRMKILTGDVIDVEPNQVVDDEADVFS